MTELVATIRMETEGFGAERLVEYAANRFGGSDGTAGSVALATSFGAEDQVLTDMLCRAGGQVKVFTLDTGRLPEETYEVMEATRRRYGIEIDVLFPDRRQVEAMVRERGPNLFYESVENRKRCCSVRKIEPLKRGLAGLDAWICGLRKSQSVTRSDMEAVAWDGQFGLIKICPLADWSDDEVWQYIRRHNVPYNKLHGAGYPSIGCAPCTRPVEAGEDIRKGRWWWEYPEHKECGLHLGTAKKTSKKENV